MGSAKNGEEAKGTLKYEDVCKNHLNTYTTSLHAINSAVVKMGKLTVATKVYRGISGRNCHAPSRQTCRKTPPNSTPTCAHAHMHGRFSFSGRVLPKEFWEANKFGVKGGIEKVRPLASIAPLASIPSPAFCKPRSS